MLYVFEIEVFLVMEKGKLFSVKILGALVLVAEEDDGLEYGLRRGQFFCKAAFNQMIEVVVAESNDAVFAIIWLSGIKQFTFIIPVGLYLYLLHHVGLSLQTISFMCYILRSESCRMMISSTFCFTLSKRN